MMEKPDKFKNRKQIPNKKMAEFLYQQEHLKEQKNFSPGQLQFHNTPFCTARMVNFFGDIHTETFSVKVNPNDKVVAVGCANGQVKIYDIYEGKVLSIGNTSRMSGFPCTSVRWKPVSTDNFIACNCDGTIKWYNRGHQAAIGHYQKKEVSYLCSDYQVKEEWCIFGTDQNSIEVFDNQTMKQSQVYEAGGPSELNLNHHTNRVFCVKCLPNDPKVFFSGGWDSTVQVWDIRVGTGSVRKICGPSVSADSLDLKKGVLLAGNYQNNNIAQLYDFGSGQLIKTLDIDEPHNSNSYCYTASFAHRSQHDLLAVGLTGSNKVKILKEGELVSEIQLQAAPLSLDFYRFNGKDFLMVGGIQGTIYSIRIDITK